MVSGLMRFERKVKGTSSRGENGIHLLDHRFCCRFLTSHDPRRNVWRMRWAFKAVFMERVEQQVPIVSMLPSGSAVKLLCRSFAFTPTQDSNQDTQIPSQYPTTQFPPVNSVSNIRSVMEVSP